MLVHPSTQSNRSHLSGTRCHIPTSKNPCTRNRPPSREPRRSSHICSPQLLALLRQHEMSPLHHAYEMLVPMPLRSSSLHETKHMYGHHPSEDTQRVSSAGCCGRWNLLQAAVLLHRMPGRSASSPCARARMAASPSPDHAVTGCPLDSPTQLWLPGLLATRKSMPSCSSLGGEGGNAPACPCASRTPVGVGSSEPSAFAALPHRCAHALSCRAVCSEAAEGAMTRSIAARCAGSTSGRHCEGAFLHCALPQTACCVAVSHRCRCTTGRSGD